MPQFFFYYNKALLIACKKVRTVSTLENSFTDFEILLLSNIKEPLLKKTIDWIFRLMTPTSIFFSILKTF